MRPLAPRWLASSVTRVIGPRLREVRVELLIVVVITLMAAVPRMVLLEEIPPGVHGDEGLTGMRADVILEDGWIGVFDPEHAFGQPAGAEYWTAALVWMFGNSVYVLRLAMALIGVATLPLAYLFYRLAAGRTTALIGLVLLAFSGWHLHYSRIALPPVSLPLAEVLAATFLLAALRWRRWWLFGLAGACLGLGLYTYNAYPFFALAVGAFVVAWLIVNRREWTVGLGSQFALFAAATVLVGLPMFHFAATETDAYFNIARRDSLFNSESYKEAGGLLDKADVILDSGRDFVKGAVFDARIDYVDGSGTRPMLDPVTSIALGLGVLLALRRLREPGIVLALIALLVIPWAGILTTGFGAYRRTVGLTAFVPLLAALPLSHLVEAGCRRAKPVAALALLIVVLVVGGVAAMSLTYYFGSYGGNSTARYVYAYSMTEASRFIDKLPEETYVLFYSGRWSFDYETRRYLAPDVQGEDRSAEFGTFDLRPDPVRDVAYVFLDPYLDRLGEVERLFPGGTRFDSAETVDTDRFAVYVLPREGRPPGGPIDLDTFDTIPTPAGADTRDATRWQDLEAIQQALSQYYREHGSYPDTESGTQSLCLYPTMDAGCALKELLGQVPVDPLGDPAANGYWYASNGATYTLWAQRESDQFEPCLERPYHLQEFDSLMCVEGP